MTFIWPRLTWPALARRHAAPWSRKISATSSNGRDMTAMRSAGLCCLSLWLSWASYEAATAGQAGSRCRRSGRLRRACSAPLNARIKTVMWRRLSDLRHSAALSAIHACRSAVCSASHASAKPEGTLLPAVSTMGDRCAIEWRTASSPSVPNVCRQRACRSTWERRQEARLPRSIIR